MRQKIALFDRRRGNPTTPTSSRIPWRSRRREEPRQGSASQSEFNSIRVNTADYRALDLLRQYDDERINVSSVSQPTSERDQRPPKPSTNELERCQSEERNPHSEQRARRRPGESLFLTSGFRVNSRGSPTTRELLSSVKDLNDENDDASFPFSEQSRDGLFLRGKGCLLILLIVLALTAIIGLSWYFFGCYSSSMKGSVHALVTANPVARLLGLTGNVDKISEARNMWINHVVKNDDNEILVAETFESRLNAEITPLLENYVDKIWGDASSPPLACHGADRLMVAFSMTKTGSMPASITYETPCMHGPSSRNCVVKKQIPDVRDLVVRLPPKSSRYMHAVRLEVGRSSKVQQTNSSEVRHIEDLGTVSGQFRVELSDASRLALQRYCGQNRKAYSEDLMTEPVSASNTRLINVYELKRLYGLLATKSDIPVSGLSAWDSRSLSAVVVDPLEHSRHSLAPIHVQQLLFHLRGKTDSQILHGTRESRFPHITVTRPQGNDFSRHSAIPSPQVSQQNNNVDARTTSPSSHPESPLPSPPPLSPLLHSSSPVDADTPPEVQTFRVQPRVSQASGSEEAHPEKNSLLVSNGDSPNAQTQTTAGDTPSSLSLTEDQLATDTGSEPADHSMTIDNEDKESTSNLPSSDSQEDTKSGGIAAERSNSRGSDGGQPIDNAATRHSQSQTAAESSERTMVTQGTETTSFVPRKGSSAHRRSQRDSSAEIPSSQVPANDPLSAPYPSRSPNSVPPSSTSAFEKQSSLTPNLQKNKPTSAASTRFSTGSQQTENRPENGPAAALSMEASKVAIGPVQTRRATIQSTANTVQGSTAPKLAIQPPAQKALSSPTQLQSHPIHGGLLPIKRAKQTLSPARKGMSPAQALSPLIKSSTSDVGALSPTATERKSSPLYQQIGTAHKSSSGAQRSSLPIQGTSTSRGAVLSPTNGGSVQNSGRSLPSQRYLNSNLVTSTAPTYLKSNLATSSVPKYLKSNLATSSPRGALPQSKLPRRVTRPQIYMHQPDTSIRETLVRLHLAQEASQ